jgi:hypothetical protein
MTSYIKDLSLIILFISLSYSPVFSQEENYLSKYEDVFGRYAKITLLNDANPVLNQTSRDYGHTLGVVAEYSFSKPENRTFYEFAVESNLYTDRVNQGYYNNVGRKINPQYFTEISSFNFTLNRYLRDKRTFLNLKTYLGVYNRKKPIPGMALFLQGGSDGKGGYHGLLKDNAGQDNIPTGKQSLLLFLEPSLKKYFIGNIFTKNDNAFLKIHSGVKLGFPFEGMNAFININSELPVIQIVSKNTNIFKLTLTYQHELTLHRDGILYKPELGAEASLLFLTMGYTSNFYFGDRNISMVKYFDDDRMMRLYIKIKLFDMLFKD